MKTAIKGSVLLCALFASAGAMAAWDGVTDWARRTEMSTPASGVIERVLVRAGERVREKTVLLQLEQGTRLARVEEAKAVQQHATLLREEAQRELDRSQELYDRTLLADHDLNLAKLAFADADATFQQARAALVSAEEELNDSQLVAPFDAIILDRKVQPAQTVMNQLRAEPMLVVASAKEMLVRFAVSPEDLAKLPPGTKVNVECQGQRYQGVVEAVKLDAHIGYGSSAQTDNTVEVIFATEQPLMPGVSASVSLP